MIVQGMGPVGAQIMLIGEAPGREEIRLGAPFVGGSGQLLDQCLNAAGIARRDCYLTNVVKIQLPNDGFDSLYEDAKKTKPGAILAKCYDEIQAEIVRIRPLIVIPLGNEALKAVTGLNGISKWRGSILKRDTTTIIPSYNPAAALRDYSLRWIIQFDLKRARKELDSRLPPLPTKNYTLRPDFDTTMRFLKSIKEGDYLSYDIETIGSVIRCLGLCVNPPTAICIPFMCMNAPTFDHTNVIIDMNQPVDPTTFNSYWPEDQELEIHKELDRIFSNQKIFKIAQNMPFDTTRLQKAFGYRFAGLWMDTMLGWHLLYAELPKGLDFLCSVLTRRQYYSDYLVSVDEQVWEYNCNDVVVTWESAFEIERMLKLQDQDEFFYRHQMPAMLHLARISSRGLQVNDTLRQSLREQYQKSCDELLAKIRAYVNMENLNPNSPLQMKKAFYEVLQMPVQKNHKTGEVTCDKNARAILARKCPQHEEWLEWLNEWSNLETIITGFINKPLRSDGRIYTHFDLAGTVTGRITSSEPLDGDGTNLTNQPRGEFRRVYVAPPGKKLIKADLTAAEWFAVCWLGKFERFIQRYKENPDWVVHKYAASMIFGINESLVAKGSNEYTYGKNGVYGSSYGMRARKASLVWKCDEQFANQVLTKWHAAAPEIRQSYWKSVMSQILSTRTLVNPMGRKRLFLDRIPYPPTELDQIFRDGYSHWAQSTIADIINRALVLCDFFFSLSECRVILQVHDELVLEVDSDKALDYAKRVKKFMEYPIKISGIDTPLLIKAEVSIGDNWYDGVKI